LTSTLNKDYREETDWLFRQFPSYQQIGSKAYKPTLDNTKSLAQFADNPERALKFVHVAGSNGKGSTCAMLASILTEAGYKVGLFTSPHITDFRERIRVNGICIDKQSVVDFIRGIKAHSFDFDPSFFEVSFVMALDYFKKQKCDICIIETGLGGRLDATNIITPLVSVITSISLEHTDILGNTLEEIATEKAGIIKPHADVVVGKIVNELTPIFTDRAKGENISIYFANEAKTNYTAPLLGKHQQDNLMSVDCTLHSLRKHGFSIPENAITNGLLRLSQNTGFNGRLQIVSDNPTIIYDVSHNPDGIKASMKAIAELEFEKLHIVYGTSQEKDVEAILAHFPLDARFYFTEFSNERTMEIEQLKAYIKQDQLVKSLFFSSANEALKTAKEKANANDLILVIGSFFLISDFF